MAARERKKRLMDRSPISREGKKKTGLAAFSSNQICLYCDHLALDASAVKSHASRANRVALTTLRWKKRKRKQPRRRELFSRGREGVDAGETLMTQQKWFLSNPSRARSSLWGVLPYLCPLSAPAERTPRPLKGAARSTEGKRAPRRSARRVREKKGLNFFDLRRRKRKSVTTSLGRPLEGE